MNTLIEQSVTRETAKSKATTRRAVKSENMLAMEREAARIRWLLAINPNTPPPVLDQLARGAQADLLERIAENPRTHSATLARLADHENPQVRASVAENINASLKTMWKLARDPSADVRMRLAESYTVPLAVLRVLVTDENPYVKLRAEKTLGRLLHEVSTLRSA